MSNWQEGERYRSQTIQLNSRVKTWTWESWLQQWHMLQSEKEVTPRIFGRKVYKWLSSHHKWSPSRQKRLDARKYERSRLRRKDHEHKENKEVPFVCCLLRPLVCLGRYSLACQIKRLEICSSNWRMRIPQTRFVVEMLLWVVLDVSFKCTVIVIIIWGARDAFIHEGGYGKQCRELWDGWFWDT